MEPLSLSLMLRILLLINSANNIKIISLVKKLDINLDRMKAIVRDLLKMELLLNNKDALTCSGEGKFLLTAFKNECWESFHNILLKKCKEYHNLIKTLETSMVGEKGLVYSQIISRSKNYRPILNQVTSEVCCDWGRRIGKIQKNLYTSGAISRFYLINDDNLRVKKIEYIIENEYLNIQNNGEINVRYVSIPNLRENVCELQKISRRKFDEVLLNLWSENIGQIELASGPLTSRARKTPTRKLTIHVDRSSAVLTPKYILQEEEGLNIGGKKYQTIVFNKYY